MRPISNSLFLKSANNDPASDALLISELLDNLSRSGEHTVVFRFYFTAPEPSRNHVPVVPELG